jgi:uncharacterized low-complexity protein
MSKEKKVLKPVSLAVGSVFVASMAASNIASADTANGNPFAMNELHSGYMQVAAEGNCGASKPMPQEKQQKEGSCGGSKAEQESQSEQKDKADKEGKCGEAKCGASK